MSLFIDGQRDEKDIDKIFSLIYAELISIYPSNDPFRIFLTYFQPLFDLTLGIAFSLYNSDIVATYYLPSISKELFVNKSLQWFDCSENNCVSACKTITEFNEKFSEETKSCLQIPVKLHGCLSEESSHRKNYEVDIGLILLFSRLQKAKFKSESNELLDYISRQITASFLHQVAREQFLYSSYMQHKCFFGNKVQCGQNGPGPLNKIGERLCRKVIKQ